MVAFTPHIRDMLVVRAARPKIAGCYTAMVPQAVIEKNRSHRARKKLDSEDGSRERAILGDAQQHIHLKHIRTIAPSSSSTQNRHSRRSTLTVTSPSSLTSYTRLKDRLYCSRVHLLASLFDLSFISFVASQHIIVFQLAHNPFSRNQLKQDLATLINNQDQSAKLTVSFSHAGAAPLVTTGDHDQLSSAHTGSSTLPTANSILTQPAHS